MENNDENGVKEDQIDDDFSSSLPTKKKKKKKPQVCSPKEFTVMTYFPFYNWNAIHKNVAARIFEFLFSCLQWTDSKNSCHFFLLPKLVSTKVLSLPPYRIL